MSPMEGAQIAIRLPDDLGAGWLPLQGLRLTALKIVNASAEVATMESGAWRRLLSGSGARAMEISGTGMFLGGAGELRLRQMALGGQILNVEVTMEEGRLLRGEFVVASLAYDGPHDEEVSYRVTLESSGPVSLL